MVKEILNATKEEDYEFLSDTAKDINVRAKEDNQEMRKIILDLKDTMKANKVDYLSAPQIGYNKRIFCISFKNEEPRTFINPLLTNASGLTLSREKSATFPNTEFIRPRSAEINMIYQNPLGKAVSQKMTGMAACITQQMIDSLDGLLLSDVSLELDENWDKATEEEREEVISEYMRSLDLKQKEITKEISKDDDLSAINKGISFIEEVNKGNVKLEKYEFKEEEIV